MASKFMKVKHIVLSAITCVLIVSQLVGCAALSSTELMELLNNGEDIEITMAIPDNHYEIQEKQQDYTWVQLDQLKTYEVEFRSLFDKLFNINKAPVNMYCLKSGCMYVNKKEELDGNTSFSDSLRNEVFMTKYFEDPDITDEISRLANKVYEDVKVGTINSVYAGLNAYFNLFNEVKDNNIYFCENQSLTREDFYSLVYRVNNGVSDIKEDEAFNAQVGTSGGSNIFACQVDEYAWLNVENNSLKPGNYKSAITRAEAVYMLMNYYCKDFIESINVKEIELTDAKNGGDMLTRGREKLQIKDKETKEIITSDAWQLGVLAKMQQGNKEFVHTDIYKALGVANQLEVIDKETNWNEPLTKSAAIDMIIKSNKALNKKKGYLTKVEYGEVAKGKVDDDDEEPVFTPDPYTVPEDDPNEKIWDESPPVVTIYNSEADLNEDGRVDIKEWEQWVEAHPEDLDKNLRITDEERAEYEDSQNKDKEEPKAKEEPKVKEEPKTEEVPKKDVPKINQDDVSESVKENARKMDEEAMKRAEEWGSDNGKTQEEIDKFNENADKGYDW